MAIATQRMSKSKPLWSGKMTPEEFLRLPDDGYKYELVNGALTMSPAGLEHEEIGVTLAALLWAHVHPHRSGRVYGSSTGYRLPSGNIRSPDVSLVSMERLPGGRSPQGFADFAPDLAVEILSPSDNVEDVEEKVKEYLDSGVRLVWGIDPARRTVTVYGALKGRQVLSIEESLTGEEVVPGFSCMVRALFAD